MNEKKTLKFFTTKLQKSDKKNIWVGKGAKSSQSSASFSSPPLPTKSNEAHMCVSQNIEPKNLQEKFIKMLNQITIF